MQGYIADSYAQLKQFRLFVLYTAWEIDKYNDYRKVRKDIAAIKVLMPARAARHRAAARCRCTARSGSATRCRSPG